MGTLSDALEVLEDDVLVAAVHFLDVFELMEVAQVVHPIVIKLQIHKGFAT